MTQKCRLMLKIMQYDFAITDLKLYLDTHPDDVDSLCTHQRLCKEYEKMYDEYCRMYGPINSYKAGANAPWSWGEECMPWEGGM